MAWWDRLRRRAAQQSAAAPSAAASSASAPSRDRAGSAPGAPGASVPGEWDGGWRRTAAPDLTVSRAPLPVSDGLAFRAGLAAWQNPSFDSGLGHALLPTAPTGLAGGVTRPPAPQATHTAGGPLLLRALRPEGAGGAQGAGGAEGAEAAGGQEDRRSGAGKPAVGGSGSGGSGAGRPGVRGPVAEGSVAGGAGAAGSEAGGAVGPTVARVTRAGRRAAPGKRRTGSPVSGAGPAVVQPSGSGDGDGTTVQRRRSGDGAPRSRGPAADDGPTATRGLTAGESPAVLSSSPAPVQRAVGPGTPPVVTPADTGPRPFVPPVPLVRRVAVVPPGTASASGSRTPQPPAGRRDAATEPAGPRAARTTGPRTARDGEQPGASRTPGTGRSRVVVPLDPAGPRLTVARHPASGPVRRVAAVPPAPAAKPAPAATPGAGPDTPVRRTATPARATRATRAGRTHAPLGAPLGELPATATPVARASTTTSAAETSTASGAGGPAGPELPVVQRQTGGPVPDDGPASGTRDTAPGAPAAGPSRTTAPGGSRARTRGGLGAPLSELPPSAELPGSTRSAAHASRPAPGPAHRGSPEPGRVPPSGAAPPAPRADAPLLGFDVQRGLAGHPVAGDAHAAPPAPADGTAPGTPLVTPPRPHPGEDRPGASGTLQPPEGRARGTRHPGVASGSPGTVGPRSGGPAAAAGPASGAADVRSGGPSPVGSGAGATGSGGRRPRSAAAAGPVVVARAVRPGDSTGGARTAGAAASHPLTGTGTGSAAPSATGTGVPRTLQLLAARPLGLSTRTPEGAAPPAAVRSGSRPVVAARRPGAAAASRVDSGTAPTAPQVQRSVTAPSGHHDRTPESGPDTTTRKGTGTGTGLHAGLRTTRPPDPVQRVPVVRPAPPRPTAAGPTAAGPARPLPVTAPQPAPLTDGPPAAPAAPAPVPVVRPRTVTPGPIAGVGPAAPVQRTATDTGAADPLRGVQVKEVPVRTRSRSSASSGAPPNTGRAAARRPDGPLDDPGPDLDELARRLLDPMARLLRTELRRGRERTGRPYDGRR
ncbi:hypothetical protein [Streptomyces sp. bgisy154]|uniref:hypothetical protein n=1 Tax=Streptomyces sp. bgisy154 TaxID=3413794 RepID=UPI003D718F9E